MCVRAYVCSFFLSFLVTPLFVFRPKMAFYLFLSAFQQKKSYIQIWYKWSNWVRVCWEQKFCACCLEREGPETLCVRIHICTVLYLLSVPWPTIISISTYSAAGPKARILCFRTIHPVRVKTECVLFFFALFFFFCCLEKRESVYDMCVCMG